MSFFSVSYENMGIWEEGEEKRLIKQRSAVGGRVVSQRLPSVSHGETWQEGLPLIPAGRVGAEPICSVTQHPIGV